MTTNSWPGGQKRAIHQTEHERWNKEHYPGTRQLCEICGRETGRSEEDEIRDENGIGPLCVDCLEGS